MEKDNQAQQRQLWEIQHLYRIQLLFAEKPPVLSAQAVHQALQQAAGSPLRLVEGDTGLLCFSLPEVTVPDGEGGRAAVVLRSDEYLSLTTLLRHQTAQLIVRTYEGIRVPKNAVRVVEEAGEGEDGTQEVSRRTAVYCRVGRLARQKPVTVLYEGEDYYLVEPDQETLSRYVESAQNIRTLRAGDEGVITAGELYDGKVLE